MNKLIILSLMLFNFSLHADDKIMGGLIPPQDHPGTFNTVALIKSADQKIFCTGSIATKRLIITAKHCLEEKGLNDFEVFFGASTNDLEAGVRIKPKRFNVRYPNGWHLSFPSADIAWIELEEDAPAGFRPLRILTEASELVPGSEMALVGYGNSSEIDGQVYAGDKLFTTTKFQRYFDHQRFQDVLLFKGEKGQGACHGDSGGPAYQLLTNEVGELEWFIVGVTNGFDLVLTPEAMARSSDPDFPFVVDCRENEILYTFVAGHGDWIEKDSGIALAKTAAFAPRSWQAENQALSLREWCEARDIGSPQWNTLKIILDHRVDQIPQHQAVDFYLDCQAIVKYLETVEEVVFKGENLLPAQYGVKNLNLLPKLKRVEFRGVDPKYLRESDFSELKVEQLSFYQTKLTTIDFLTRGLEVRELDLRDGALESIAGLENVVGLERLVLDRNPLTEMSALTEIDSLKSLSLGYVNLASFSFLRDLTTIEELDLTGSNFSAGEEIKELKSLRLLRLFNQSFNSLDLSELEALEVLSLNSVKAPKIILKNHPHLHTLELNHTGLKDIHFIANFKALESLSLSSNEVSDLSSLAKLSGLKRLYLAANPVRDLSPLKGLSQLQTLGLFQTPIARGQVPKTPDNCPLEGPSVLVSFCSR